MIFENINITSISIFGVLVAIFIFLAYKSYQNSKKWKYKKGNYLLKISLLFLSFLFALLGMFHPKGGEKKTELKTKGVDVMFVLDVSKSMNSIDIQNGNYLSTRLDLAKKAISNYITKHPNNRYGLVIFAGNAISSIPLTKDKNVFLTILQGLDYKNLTKQGTNFNQAIKLALGRFTNDKAGKVMIIISDGGDDGDYNGLNVKLPKNLKTFVIGVGTTQGGKIYLGQTVFGDYKFQKYKGQYVITHLNENNLKKLAKDLNGEYIRLDNIGKLNLIDEKINNLTKQAHKSSITERKDLIRTFTIISFIFFVLFMIQDSRIKIG